MTMEYGLIIPDQLPIFDYSFNQWSIHFTSSDFPGLSAGDPNNPERPASSVESQITDNDFWDESKAEINLYEAKSVQAEYEESFTQNIRDNDDKNVIPYSLVLTNPSGDFGGSLR